MSSQCEFDTTLTPTRGDKVRLGDLDCTVTVGYECDGDSTDWWPLKFVFEDRTAQEIKNNDPPRLAHIEPGDLWFPILADTLAEMDDEVCEKIADQERERRSEKHKGYRALVWGH